MTDKQIIVDGVDMSGCIYFKKNNKMPMCRACNSGVGSPYCEYHKDCYYKQLKAKEQECDELREEIKTNGFACFNIEMAEQLNQLKKSNEELQTENEKMSKGYAELTEIVRPYIDDFTGYNEKLGGFDIVLCVKELLQQLDQLKVENEELKKTLTEIKKIAERGFQHSQCNCGAKADLDLILQKICGAINE